MSTNYVIATHRFTVDWGGTNIGFQEVSGLDMETEVISYEHGAMIDGTAPMKSPGKTKYSDAITLKRGYFKGDDEMQQWLQDVRINETARRDITITLLDEVQAPVMVWRVMKAWVSKIDGVGLNSGSSEAALENVTITHEGYALEMIPA